MFGVIPSKDELLDLEAELNKKFQSIKKLTVSKKIEVICKDNFKLLTLAVITNNIPIFNNLTNTLKSTTEGTKKLKEFLSVHRINYLNSYELTTSAAYKNFDMCKNIVKLIVDMKLDLEKILKTADYVPLLILLGCAQHKIIFDSIDSDPISFISKILIEQGNNEKFDFIDSVIKDFDTKSLETLYTQLEKEASSNKDAKFDFEDFIFYALGACCKYDKKDFLKYILDGIK